MAKSQKKNVPSEAEIKNDPSLRWYPYKVGELIWSIHHQQYLRFGGYNEDGTVKLLSYYFAQTDKTADRLQVRRPNAGTEPNPDITMKELTDGKKEKTPTDKRPSN